MASSSQTVTARIELPISPGDVGKFIGAKAFALRKFVINKAKNSFSDDHDGDEFTPPRVSVVTDDDKVFAECSAHCQELIDLLKINLLKHAGAQSKPQVVKPKICRLVFKSNMSGKQISKFIGAGGKNCKALSTELHDIASNDPKTKDAESFRVKICEPDIYDDRKTPQKFFEIKNGNTGNEVFIFVTAKFVGHPRNLFLAIKSRMIESVTSLSEYSDYYNPDALSFDDVLGGGGGDPVSGEASVSLDAFGRSISNTSNDDGNDDPAHPGAMSPGYSPSSPTA